MLREHNCTREFGTDKHFQFLLTQTIHSQHIYSQEHLYVPKMTESFLSFNMGYGQTLSYYEHEMIMNAIKSTIL